MHYLNKIERFLHNLYRGIFLNLFKFFFYNMIERSQRAGINMIYIFFLSVSNLLLFTGKEGIYIFPDRYCIHKISYAQ